MPGKTLGAGKAVSTGPDHPAVLIVGNGGPEPDPKIT